MEETHTISIRLSWAALIRDAPLCMSWYRPVIAVRPSSTSCSRSRRPLDGLGGAFVAVFRHECIGDTRGRDKRPGLYALLKVVARRDFDMVATWPVC
jgi:hypothetical protein